MHAVDIQVKHNHPSQRRTTLQVQKVDETKSQIMNKKNHDSHYGKGTEGNRLGKLNVVTRYHSTIPDTQKKNVETLSQNDSEQNVKVKSTKFHGRDKQQILHNGTKERLYTR